MKHALLAAAAGAGVAAAILVSGGVGRLDVWLLAGVAGVVYVALTHRGLAESAEGAGDATDFWMSLAFVAILVAAAWERRAAPPGRITDLHAWLVVLGLVTIALGVTLRRWAVVAMGREFRFRLGVRADHRLVEEGPFRWIRHPTYAGLFLVALGTSAALESSRALVAALGVWLPVMLVRIAREERLLAARFAQAWTEYRRRTRRLVPGIY